ncbi:MAG TPA: hypothetical protein DCY27_01690, partial [Desulfobacterales bacterium]|nr:hypothetical protein [Desulfobacterales bacterium]
MYREPKNRQVALRLLVLIILICLGDASVVAAPGPASPFTLQVKVFNRQNSGLPGTLVEVILPDKEGGLWVGTWMGLARFHQGQWRVFTKENSGLPHDGVKALALNQDGSLWVGTYYGLARYSPAQDKWEVFTKANSGLPGNDVDSLAATPDGALWVAATDNIIKNGALERQYSHLSLFHHGKWQDFHLHKDVGFSIFADQHLHAMPDGTVWLWNSQGCLARFREGRWQTLVNFEYNPATGVNKRVKAPEGFVGLTQRLRCLLLMPDGALWLGTEGGGLARFHQGRLQVFTPENSGLPSKNVLHLTEVPHF